MLGIATKRSLPKLHKQTLRTWFKSFKQPKKSRKVYLFCDEYTNYYDVEIGKKAILLLNKLGYEVLMITHEESGRAYISKGFLKEAKKIAISNVTHFKDLVSEKTPLIGIEPSTILSFRDEYINLVDASIKKEARALSQSVFLIDEFLANEIKAKRINSDVFTKESKQIMLHGHCHQKALSQTKFTKCILSLPLNYTVSEIPSGCCGMAGSFGYEKEHYQLSHKIGNQVLFPTIKNSHDKIELAANGTSCRHQIFDGVNKVAKHPVEILYDALL
jgi:Fe-S oxidoreductase